MGDLDIKVRLAQDSERETVKALVDQMGGWDLEFKTIFPYWLVAEIAGEVVATLNIRLSMPVSSVEMMAIDPKLTREQRREVILMLTDSAMAICAAHGAEGISSMVTDDMDHFLRFAQRHGYTVGYHGSIIFRRTPHA